MRAKCCINTGRSGGATGDGTTQRGAIWRTWRQVQPHSSILSTALAMPHDASLGMTARDWSRHGENNADGHSMPRACRLAGRFQNVLARSSRGGCAVSRLRLRIAKVLPFIAPPRSTRCVERVVDVPVRPARAGRAHLCRSPETMIRLLPPEQDAEDQQDHLFEVGYRFAAQRLEVQRDVQARAAITDLSEGFKDIRPAVGKEAGRADIMPKRRRPRHLPWNDRSIP